MDSVNKILTIAIPTYNRADLLKEQLYRLSEALEGFEADCEVIISDNCSTDHTKDVIEEFRQNSKIKDLKSYKQKQNLGALRNIAHCIKVATGQYVWVVSDDDKLHKRSVDKVLSSISNNPSLGLIVLNYSTFQPEKDEITKEREYALDNDDFCENGMEFFEKYLAVSWGGLVFTTALVYRTELAKTAVEDWFAAVDNSMFQLYITSFCAKHGSALMTKDSFLTWVARKNFVFNNKKLFIQHHFMDVPIVFLKLTEMGYSQSLCKNMMADRFFSLGGINCSLRLLAARPLYSLRVLRRHTAVMGQLFSLRST